MRRGIVAAALAVALAPCWSLLAAEPPVTPRKEGGQQSQAVETDPHPSDDARPRFHGTENVVASRIASDAAAAGRREIVLTREEIEQLPAQSVADLMAFIPGVGLTRRGARGVQGDLNLRGSTFEQVLVMVNGVRVNNPQTGHHHLDLFVPLAAVDRVEVLYGSGSAVHGPDAFGGAINIITSQPVTSAYFRIGENDLTGGGAAIALGSGFWVAAEREVQTGFRYNTEADVNQLAAGWSWRKNQTTVDVLFDTGARDFGAHAFYSTRFPDQWESTEGRLLTLRAATPVGPTELEVAVRLDSHQDTFLLDRNRPDWYRNEHETRGGLVSVSFTGNLSRWDWAAGAEAARDQIDSSNLGAHHRSRAGAFVELGRLQGRNTFSLQARFDHQKSWGTETTLAAGGSLGLGKKWRLRGHYGESFRAPSFTELYYTSPSRVGDPDLEPERGRSIEAGFDRGPLSVTLFRREAEPIIDYLLDYDEVWRARNIGRIITSGLEVAVTLPTAGRLRWQRVGLVVLDSEIDVDPERSAYALAHPAAEAVWTGALDTGRGWTTGWAARWRDPQTGGSWSTLDVWLERRVLEQLTVTVEASNLFDRKITELHGVPLPGRWVSLTLGWRAQRP